MPDYGSYTYNRLALGKETTPGTSVNRTTIWRGPFGDIEDAREREQVEENIGLLVSAERTYNARLAALLSMPSTPLTYEQFPHILEASIKAATPSGTAAPYTRSYPFPVSNTLNVIKTYSLEAGNAVVTGDVRLMEYGFVESFTMSGTQGEPWMMAANWRGRQVGETTYTTGLSIPPVEEALFANTRLFIDAAGGTFGTTQKTGVLVGANIEIDTGIRPVWVGDGNLYFLTHKFHRPALTFSLTMELESGGAVKAERDAYEANVIRLLYLTCPGSGGRSLNISFPVKYDDVDPYEDADGNTHVTLNGHAVYDSVSATYCLIEVLNTLAALP